MSRTLGVSVDIRERIGSRTNQQANEQSAEVLDVQGVEGFDQQPGPSSSTLDTQDSRQTKTKRKRTLLGKLRSDKSPFGTALRGLANKKDAKNLELEIGNLNNQLKSLRKNLRSEIELKGKLGKLIKSREFKIAELQMQLDSERGKLETMERVKTETEASLKNSKEKAQFIMNMMKEDLVSK